MIRFALRHPTSVVALMIIMAITGFYAYRTMPREAAPDINLPFVIVTVPYYGVAPEDIESLVIVPLEKKLKELKNVKKMRATAAEGAGIIMLEFETSVEIDDAVIQVRSKVDLAEPEMPSGIETPMVDEINFAEFPILSLSLSADYAPHRLKAVADDLKDRIEGVPGVLGVDVAGGFERQILINVDPDRLRHHDLTMDDFIKMVQVENVNLPGGSVAVDGMKYGLRVAGEFETVGQVMDVIVAVHEGHPIRVRDVADVVDGMDENRTHARLDGVQGMQLQIKKRIGANIIQVADAVKEVIEADAALWPEGTRHALTFDASRDIRAMVTDLENNILSGLLLVLLTLPIFLGFRNSVLVALAIPFASFVTFAFLLAYGVTLNIVVLFSLILSVGSQVDNSIVIIENIFRHYAMGKSRYDSAFIGTSEVFWPVLSSTIATNSAYVPLLFWPGIMGEWMWYLPLVVLAANTASFLITMVMNPVLAATFMTRKGFVDDLRVIAAEKQHPILRRYGAFLDFALRHRWPAAILPMLLLPVLVVLFGFFGGGVEFFPEIDPNIANVNIRLPEGTSLDKTDTLSREIEERLAGAEGMKYLTSSIGVAPSEGAVLNTGAAEANANKAVLTLNFVPFEEREKPSKQVIEELRPLITRMPGAEITLKKGDDGPPTGAPVNIEIQGDDYATLKVLSDTIRSRIDGIEHMVDLKDDFEGGRPEIRIHVDRDKAARLKLNTMAVSSLVRTAVQGVEAGKFREGDEEYDIVVRLPLEKRSSWTDILDLPLANEDGVPIPLSNVATIEKTGGYGTLRRIDQKRTITVTANVTAAQHADPVLKEVIARVKDIPLPPGYRIDYTGENEERDKAARFLSQAFFSALFMILIVLITQFNSVAIPALILNSVPMSLIGVFLGLLVTGTPFGIVMTGLGIIGLAGVVVNNGIVLVDFIEQSAHEGMPRQAAIRYAGLVRLRPVVLTAITSVVGLLPTALDVNLDFSGLVARLFTLPWDFSGFAFIAFGTETAQWWTSMAHAMIFGFIVATVLTLVVLPVTYSIMDDIAGWIKRKTGFHLVTGSDPVKAPESKPEPPAE